MIRDHGEFQARVNDFADDGLPEGERRRMAEHLDECEQCRGELEGVLALRAEARALPRAIAPARDLWPEIAARLHPRAAPSATGEEAPASAVAIPLDARRRLPGIGQRVWPMQAAAAVALVLLSSAGTAYWLSRTGATAPVATVAGPPAAAASPALAAFASTEDEYRRTVESLRAEFDRRRPSLLPETVATVERSLQLIDQAILEAQAALAADPNNPEIPLLLSGVYRQKVELLQRAAQLSART